MCRYAADFRVPSLRVFAGSGTRNTSGSPQCGGDWLTGQVAMSGDVLAYCGGSRDELSMLTVIGFGFVELPALLVLVLAMVVYWVGLARERIRPPAVAWSLITPITSHAATLE
jgi:hypothetical protein